MMQSTSSAEDHNFPLGLTVENFNGPLFLERKGSFIGKCNCSLFGAERNPIKLIKNQSQTEANAPPQRSLSCYELASHPHPKFKLSQQILKVFESHASSKYASHTSSTPHGSSPHLLLPPPPLPPSTMRMSHLVGFLLWTPIFLFMFHGLSQYFRHTGGTHPVQMAMVINRKLLTARSWHQSSPFDTQNLHRSPPVAVAEPDPDGSQIDPRYGVEKRLVPTGPNPLHH